MVLSLRQLVVLVCITSFDVWATPALQYRDVTMHNCTTDTIPCGPGASCCPSGYICNMRRGIPACENLGLSLISGFGGSPCNDPYLFDCSILGVSGSCCPVGTVCFHYLKDDFVSCIDAYGTTAPAYPSATTGVAPVVTQVAIDDPGISYQPSDAWSTASNIPGCTASGSLRVTSQINSTVSFNYTGPSIMIHTVTSPKGGVFSVFVDGFNTSDTIDTYSGNGTTQLPQCLPVQFPPFTTPPPNFANHSDHSITLVYTGRSPNQPNNENSSTVQFDSFAIPQFKMSSAHGHGHGAKSIATSIIGFTLCIFGLGIM